MGDIAKRWRTDYDRSAADYTDAGCRVLAEHGFRDVAALLAALTRLQERAEKEEARHKADVLDLLASGDEARAEWAKARARAEEAETATVNVRKAYDDVVLINQGIGERLRAAEAERDKAGLVVAALNAVIENQWQPKLEAAEAKVKALEGLAEEER